MRIPNAEKYNLGHNEQMQIQLALSQVIEMLETHELNDGDEVLPDILQGVTLEVMHEMEALFQSHGTVSIVRTLQDD